MKFKFTYIALIFTSILTWTLTTSDKGGKSTFTDCSGCHGGSSSVTLMDSITLTEVSSGLVVTKYKPATAYTIKFYGNNSATLPKYGFQINPSKGIISAPPANTQITYVTSNPKDTFWQHSLPLTGSGGKYSQAATWTSPAAGSGTVTFETWLNAVDGQLNTTGDAVSSLSTFSFNEQTAGADTAKVSIAITTGGNPSKFGDVVKFTATAINGGTSPLFQWKKNGVNIGTASSTNTYSTTTLNNKDSIWCILTSNLPGVVGSPASTNKIVMTILGSSSIQSLNKELFDIHIENMILKTITFENKNYDLTIYNFNGSKVYVNSTNNTKEHNISYLPKGIYFSTIQINDKIYTKKFSIQ